MKFFNNFKGLKDIGTIGTANILGSTISAFFWIFLASLMGSENYGELSYYISIAGIATSISFVGGPKALVVLIAKKYEIESTVYFLSIFTSLISSIILYFAFEHALKQLFHTALNNNIITLAIAVEPKQHGGSNE